MILDGPTAALDTESERLVIDGLRELMKGRTVIMIAHRLSTISEADKIVVLKDGMVAEEGSIERCLPVMGFTPSFIAFSTKQRGNSPANAALASPQWEHPDQKMSHTLIVLPDDTISAILEPINAARRSLNIRMFLFTEPTLLRAVIAAHQRGVNVRVMLNPARRNGKSENPKARKALLAAGIEVRDSSAAFALTHQKSMVIDDKTGFVESLNWEPRDLTETRDYAVTTTKKSEVKEMIRCFNADWARRTFSPDPKSRLIWCPNNGRERIATIIDGAKKSLWLQNERYQDTVIIERIVRAVNRGVASGSWLAPRTSFKARSLLKASVACASCMTSGRRFTC